MDLKGFDGPSLKVYFLLHWFDVLLDDPSLGGPDGGLSPKRTKWWFPIGKLDGHPVFEELKKLPDFDNRFQQVVKL